MALRTDKEGLTHLTALLKTVHGNIEIKFYSREAPVSVSRFIQLIKEGFYDGLKFHRVIPKFVIQSGDPTGTGTGGSGRTLKGEFNSIPHIKGTVALARGEGPDSSDSQFYMALTTLPHLDGKYTVIGQVVKGLDVLDKISKNDVIVSFSVKKK
jgi:cyclophilin family peptidyl-prolyl cis-trans isomerase